MWISLPILPKEKEAEKRFLISPRSHLQAESSPELFLGHRSIQREGQRPSFAKARAGFRLTRGAPWAGDGPGGPAPNQGGVGGGGSSAAGLYRTGPASQAAGPRPASWSLRLQPGAWRLGKPPCGSATGNGHCHWGPGDEPASRRPPKSQYPPPIQPVGVSACRDRSPCATSALRPHQQVLLQSHTVGSGCHPNAGRACLFRTGGRGGVTFRSSGRGGDLSWGSSVATKRALRERWPCSHLQRLGQCPCLGRAEAQLLCAFWDVPPLAPPPSRRHSEPRQSVRAGLGGGAPRSCCGRTDAHEESPATRPHSVMGPVGACSGSPILGGPCAPRSHSYPQRDPKTLETAGNAKALGPAASPWTLP